MLQLIRVNVFVLSDLHIRGPVDPMYHLFLEVLRHRVGEGDRVVLAGDIFDLFVGGKEAFVGPYREYFGVIEELGRRRVQLTYIEGNHDFLLRAAYRNYKNVQLLPHHLEMEIEGRRFYIAHGDTIDRCDLGYLGLRLFFRSPVMSTLVRLTPGKWLQKFGNGSSRLSRLYHQQPMIESLAGSERDELRRKYRNFAADLISKGFDFVVAGHCHDRDEMRFQVDGREGQYINVGYPPVHRTFLVWKSGASWFEREDFPRSAFDRW